MVHLGQIPDRAPEPARAPGWSAVSTATLRELSCDPGFHRPVLLDHHLLMLVTVGHGSHDVDFVTYACRPGSLLWARPGQVMRYGGQSGLDAIVICWSAGAVDGLSGGTEALDDPFGPTYWQLAGEDEDAVINEVSQLVVDCTRHDSGGRALELLRHQLAVLLLRITMLPSASRPPAGQPMGDAATFERLRRAVEQSYAQSRRVEDYAERLGCSVRTLTRACLSASNRSAKQVIDDRVALQAMRLLAATDESIADIGRRLGFPEPTNFGRFFHREVGRSPGTFRAGLRAHHVRVPAQRQPLTSHSVRGGIGPPLHP